MDTSPHTLQTLFEQLGLSSSETAIENFVFNNPNITCGCLGNLANVVKHDGFEGIFLFCLAIGENVVEVVS